MVLWRAVFLLTELWLFWHRQETVEVLPSKAAKQM
jgi:hypothetical protein